MANKLDYRRYYVRQCLSCRYANEDASNCMRDNYSLTRQRNCCAHFEAKPGLSGLTPVLNVGSKKHPVYTLMDGREV